MTQHLHGGKHKARTLTALTLSVLLGATLTTGCTKKPEAAAQTPAPAKTTTQPQRNPENPTQNTSSKTPQDHPLPKGFRDTWSNIPVPKPYTEQSLADETGARAAGIYCVHLYIWGGYNANATPGLAQSIPGSNYYRMLKEFADESKIKRVAIEDGSAYLEWVEIGGIKNKDNEYYVRMGGKNDPVRIFSRTTGKMEEHPKGTFDVTVLVRRVNNEWKCIDIGKLR